MKTQTILVLTDFSKKAAHAANYAMEIAEKTEGKVMIFNAFWIPPILPAETGVYPYYRGYPEIRDENSRELEKFADEVKKTFSDGRKGRIPPVTVENNGGTLGDTVAEIVKKRNVWLVVMGDKRPDTGLSRFIFGSSCEDVIDKCPCPVLLVPEKAEINPPQIIAFASALQRSERKAYDFAARLAALWLSKLEVAHVTDAGLSIRQKAENFEQYRHMTSNVDYPNVSYIDLRGDDVAEKLARYASNAKVGILAVVHRKRSAVSKMLHRSVSKKLMRHYHLPLLVLR